MVVAKKHGAAAAAAKMAALAAACLTDHWPVSFSPATMLTIGWYQRLDTLRGQML